MTVFDYAFLSVLGLSTVLGLWRGLVSEILGLAALILALIVASHYVDIAAPRFENMIADSRVRMVVVFTMIFFSILLVVSLVKLFLRHLLRAVGLGATDRFFGAVFGAVRGAAIALVAVWVGGMVGMSRELWWEQALFAPPLEKAVNEVKVWLPGIDSIADTIRFE